jgi:Ca2+-binding RTX toxin-like protein
MLLRLVPLVIAAGAVAAPAADAAVGCSYDDGLPLGAGNNSATVTMSAGGDEAVIGIAGDPAEIRVNGSPCSLTPLGGTRARLDNLDTIRVNDTSGTGNTVARIERPAQFAPGESAESDTTPEIEFEIDLGDGARDALVTAPTGEDVADHVRMGVADGASRADFNAGAEATHEDPDVRLAGVEGSALQGGDGEDRLSAAGGPGFGSPLPEAVGLFGQAASDELEGGSANDVLNGGPGNDLLDGGAGTDRYDGAEGDQDYVDLHGEPVVAANLAAGTATASGATELLTNVEGVLGTRGEDLLEGDGAPLNIFDGARGDDVLRGRAGRDVMLGFNGDDTASGGLGADVIAGEKGRDLLSGGRGQDIVTAKGGGDDDVRCGSGRDGYLADRHDEVTDCEIELTESGNGAYKVASTGRAFDALGFERASATDHLPVRLWNR